jgi:amino acid transporter
LTLPRAAGELERDGTGWTERLVAFVLGAPIADSETKTAEIGPLVGVPALGLDALCSAAYGPEAALTMLLPLGLAGVGYMLPITLVIVALALLVYFSYRQTIAAYPNGGGSYTVATENLGPRVGILAAAALACDYVLNVAVAISAGVGALASALPWLLPHLLGACLGVLALLVFLNLRGTRDAGVAFLAPTYAFVASLRAVLAIGGVKTWLAGGHPTPVMAPPALPRPLAVVGFWLVCRAFANGCTAMTGIEAVSNGVGAFREPRAKNAQRTLTLIVVILVSLLAGIALLCRAYGVGATAPGSEHYQSVLSALTAAVVGRGAFYYVTMTTIVAVLCLSANTSFAGFPRLCSLLANDGYLPETFGLRGRRLVFTAGVLLLAALSALLLLGFGGVTDRLIPLFALGALLAFTFSQAGMVVHWRRQGGRGHRRALVLNLAGALATALTTLVVGVSKFVEGAWVAILALVLTAATFSGIRRHFTKVRRELHDRRPVDPRAPEPPLVVIPLAGWDKLARRSLHFARRLSADIHAVHVTSGDGEPELVVEWERFVAAPARAAGAAVPELVLRRSRYRRFFGPLLEYVHELRVRHPERDLVVVVPSVVARRWYERPLHNERGALLKALLRVRSDDRVIVVSLPLHLAH